jgi:hypothetical protein
MWLQMPILVWIANITWTMVEVLNSGQGLRRFPPFTFSWFYRSIPSLVACKMFWALLPPCMKRCTFNFFGNSNFFKFDRA